MTVHHVKKKEIVDLTAPFDDDDDDTDTDTTVWIKPENLKDKD